jgi:hypothetical protein
MHSGYNATLHPSRIHCPVRRCRLPARLVEDSGVVAHGVIAYSPNTLVAALEGRGVWREMKSLPMTHLPDYPVVYLPREDSPKSASDGLIVRLSTSARLAKSRIFSSGLVVSVRLNIASGRPFQKVSMLLPIHQDLHRRAPKGHASSWVRVWITVKSTVFPVFLGGNM